MADPLDTIPATNSQTPTDQTASKDAPPAPGSPDTSSPTTETNPAADDEGSLLGDAKTEGDNDGGADSDAGNAYGDRTGDGGDADANPLFGAPAEDASYEIAGLPDGMSIDADALAAVTPLARELNLSNEGLSKLAGVYTESVLPGVVKQMETDLQTQAAQVRKDWGTDARAAVQGGVNAAGEQVEADPVYAGHTLSEVQTTAAKALDRFGGEGFREFLNGNGLGNHPMMVRFSFLAGKAISEDTNFERGAGVPSAPLTREEKYYGKQA